MIHVILLIGLLLGLDASAVDYTGCFPKFKTGDGEAFAFDRNGNLIVQGGKKNADGFEVVKEDRYRPSVLPPSLKENYVLRQIGSKPDKLIYKRFEFSFSKETILQFEYKNDSCYLSRVVVTPDILRIKDIKKFVKYDYDFCAKLLETELRLTEVEGRLRVVKIIDAFEKSLAVQGLTYFWFRKEESLEKKYAFAKEAISDCMDFRKKYRILVD